MTVAERRRIRVRGVVQGVGFRPFVQTTATRLGLSGQVANDAAGVLAEAEGDPAALDALVAALRAAPPPAARVAGVEVTGLVPTGELGFRVVRGAPVAGEARTPIPPDLATCADCLRELRDPGDRRFGHPFVSCTACGPRFTILTAMPYDRAHTTMAGFPLCDRCRAEYEDPADRRFHAEAICCPDCGPVLALERPGVPALAGDDALSAARELLAAGAIVAVTGLGGAQLACDAADAGAVARLRERKGREAKPLAVLVRDLDAARALADVDDAAAAALAAPQAPIVLVPRRPGAPLAAGVCGASPWVGLLLPSTPLHHLLLDAPAPGALVLTSANPSGAPIAYRPQDIAALAGTLADALLTHDRPIAGPCDDSVLRARPSGPVLLRRARGYAPLPVALPVPAPEPVLAVGGELKAAPALAVGGEAHLGQHLGDAGDPATVEALGEAAARLETLLAAPAARLVCDRHPAYRSSAWARARAGARPVLAVQHHHAHAASILAEHGLAGDARVLALTFDGSGFGDDGAVWGGEGLLASLHGFERVAHLALVPLPGGEAAVRSPARMALAHLHAAGIAWTPDLPPVAALDDRERGVVLHQLRTGLNAPPTTSMGRLFDAVASLAGLCQRSRFEGEAAMLLEGAASAAAAEPYRLELRGSGPIVLGPGPLLAAVVADVRAGVGSGTIAARFHAAIAQAVADVADAVRDAHGVDTVALTGGVFANVVLLDLTEAELGRRGLRVLTHRLVPPGDGGLALGQAAIAAAGAR